MSSAILTIIMLPLIVLMTIAGLYVFVPKGFRKEQGKIKPYRFLLGTMPYILTVITLYVFIQLREYITDYIGISRHLNYATYILMIEGNAVSQIQNFASPMLTYVSGAIYLLGFSFILTFTFILLIYTRNLKGLQEFAIAYTIIYILATPFHTFMPVKVTGHTLTGVDTLLYNISPIIEQGVRFGDMGLNNCFPSMHAALSFMTMLVVFSRTDLKRYKAFIALMVLSIQFTILYLGIHWISDMVAGIILAFVGYSIATKYRKTILKLPQRIMVAFERKAGIEDIIVCGNCSEDIHVIPHVTHVKCPSCGTDHKFHPLVNSR